ncbi:MAG: PLP-dependent aminotransferase family protein [Lachnospiraceae bacterium]
MNELTINLNLKSTTPLYEQLYFYIKNEIQLGKIPRGERLPSTRSLAGYLDISRSTVQLAYEQLQSEGYIETIPCKGFYVAQIDMLYHITQVIEEPRQGKEEERTDYQYDFTPNGIDLNGFPYNTWRKLSKDVLQDDRTELFRLGDSQGEFQLRRTICNYLFQSRGVHCNPNQMIVGAGNEYLLMLLGAILGQNHKIAFENPTYRQAYKLFQNLSYEVFAVDMDKNGMEVSKLREVGADMAYVTPSHQYPLGIVMPMKRRMELLRWAGELEGRYIIEDDYDSEFRYRGKPIPALQGYDVEGKVIYLGTFSKSIAPAIRISYMVLPKPLLSLYQEKTKFLNSTVSKVDQMIVQRFIDEGYYERHLNKTRALYKGRHDKMLLGLRPLLQRCSISGEYAGVHMLLSFCNGMTEETLIQAAEQVGIKVYGLSEYYMGGKSPREATILLGYANVTEDEITKAMKILDKVWQ